MEIVQASGFFISITGQIERAEYPTFDNLYCKYCFVYGPDWEVVSGLEEGISQMAQKSHDKRQEIVWNFPIEVCFKSTNPFGWPKIVLSVYGLDALGNDVVRGYGITHLPITPGNTVKNVHTFAPNSSTFLQKITSYITGKLPEFVNPKILASPFGREVTRVRSNGNVYLNMNAVFKDIAKFGFSITS